MVRTFLCGILALAIALSAATGAEQPVAGTMSLSGRPDDYLAIALPNVAGSEWMDPEFLQQLRVGATSFALTEGESRTLALKLKKRP